MKVEETKIGWIALKDYLEEGISDLFTDILEDYTLCTDELRRKCEEKGKCRNLDENFDGDDSTDEDASPVFKKCVKVKATFSIEEI